MIFSNFMIAYLQHHIRNDDRADKSTRKGQQSNDRDFKTCALEQIHFHLRNGEACIGQHWRNQLQHAKLASAFQHISITWELRQGNDNPENGDPGNRRNSSQRYGMANKHTAHTASIQY